MWAYIKDNKIEQIYQRQGEEQQTKMGNNCSSCGCTDQSEFKINEVQLDDKAARRSFQQDSGMRGSYGGNKTHLSGAMVSSFTFTIAITFIISHLNRSFEFACISICQFLTFPSTENLTDTD